MQITPTGGAGAAGAGVSEAKLPAPGIGPTPPAAASSSAVQAAPVLADSVMVRELAVSDLLKLTQILQPTSPPERVAHVDNLIRQTAVAIADGRLEWAVGRVIEAAMADPSRVEELRSKPELEAIRPNVEQLIGRLTNVAKMDAETKLSSAERLIEDSGVKRLPHWETSPEALVNLGHRLIEAGGYANYIKTAELAGTLQTAYWAATLVQPGAPIAGTKAASKTEGTRAAKSSQTLVYHAWDVLREKLPPKVSNLWRRAPLLVMFAAWLILGVAGLLVSRVMRALSPGSWFATTGDFGVQIWAFGFLALVAFGFLARVKNRRT